MGISRLRAGQREQAERTDASDLSFSNARMTRGVSSRMVRNADLHVVPMAWLNINVRGAGMFLHSLSGARGT